MCGELILAALSHSLTPSQESSHTAPSSWRRTGSTSAKSYVTVWPGLNIEAMILPVRARVSDFRLIQTGIGIDGDENGSPCILFKEVGKVAALRKHIADAVATPYPSDAKASNGNGHGLTVDMNKIFLSQTSMAHTRWATHGVPSPLNCHPHVSDALTEFSLVHSKSRFCIYVRCELTFGRRHHHELWVVWPQLLLKRTA